MPKTALNLPIRETSARRTPDAFAALLSQSLLEFRGYAMSFARCETAADDILQESALKAWRGRGHFLMGSDFRAWFCRIVRNEAISAFRRRRPAADIWTVPEALLATNGGQEERIAAGELLRILADLPAPHKDILTLVCTDELTYEEAADAMDCTVSTIKSRLWRARAEMQKRLFEKGHRPRPRKLTRPLKERGRLAPCAAP